MTETTPGSIPYLEDTDAKVAFLKNPQVYPQQPPRVDHFETHTSWIFLTEQRVYKLKKPLRYDYLDFSSLEARYRNCQAEVQLNRRLTQGVYLGIVALTVCPDGDIELGGAGQSIDWLVEMRRLSADRELEGQLKQGAVKEQDLVDLAQLLAEFYNRAPPVPITESEYRHRFQRDIEENIQELASPDFALPISWLTTITRAQQRFLDRHSDLFAERVDEGRIIEAHGDLRPEHIYLEERPQIIDCLEFNRQFRILDCIDELAFLVMECERLQAPFVGTVLFDTYRRCTGDDAPPSLIHFYMSYRALLWARLAILHVRRRGPEQRPKWTARTHHYLRLADSHIQRVS